MLAQHVFPAGTGMILPGASDGERKCGHRLRWPIDRSPASANDRTPVGSPRRPAPANALGGSHRPVREAPEIRPSAQGTLPGPRGTDTKLPRLRRPFPLLRLRSARRCFQLDDAHDWRLIPRVGGAGEALVRREKCNPIRLKCTDPTRPYTERLSCADHREPVMVQKVFDVHGRRSSTFTIVEMQTCPGGHRSIAQSVGGTSVRATATTPSTAIVRRWR